MELALGNFLTFQRQGQVLHRFQNFFIGETVTRENYDYGFLPFGFSGVTFNKNGDSTEASLIFPNNQLSQSWTVEATQLRWLAHVEVLFIDPNNHSGAYRLHQYWGRVVSARWDESNVTVSLGSILDAVGADVPVRKLSQNLIGAIPVTSGVRLQ